MHADLPLHKSTFLRIVGLEHDAFSIRIPARLMLCWPVIEVSVPPQVDPYNGQREAHLLRGGTTGLQEHLMRMSGAGSHVLD